MTHMSASEAFVETLASHGVTDAVSYTHLTLPTKA